VECAVIRGLGLGQGIPKTDELAIALFPATCSYLISENEKKKKLKPDFSWLSGLIMLHTFWHAKAFFLL